MDTDSKISLSLDDVVKADRDERKKQRQQHTQQRRGNNRGAAAAGAAGGRGGRVAGGGGGRGGATFNNRGGRGGGSAGPIRNNRGQQQQRSVSSAPTVVIHRQVQGGGGFFQHDDRNGQPQQQVQQQQVQQVQRPTQLSTGTKVFVSNLNPEVTTEDLEDLFTKYGGPVKKALVHFDKNGVSVGTGEVIFTRSSDASKAVSTLNGVPLDSRPLQLVLLPATPAAAGRPAPY